MTEMSLLSVRNLVKRYKDFTAVEDFSIDIRAGEILTLLGPSGSGKSTVLSMIAGFSRPDDGRILLRDRDITGWNPEQRAFGMVYQGYALFPHMTVAENVAFGLRMRGRSRAETGTRVASLLQRVRLTGMEGRLPRELSGGQQQRVALARAIAFEPNLLLLDEPLSALDRQLRAEVQRELRDLNRDLGLTFIFVTHDQDEALSLSDRVAVMNAGKLVQVGTPSELYEHPANRFIAGFLGQSNFIEGVVTGYSDGVVLVRVGEWTLAASSQRRIETGRRVALALRPERVAIDAEAALENTVRGVVRARTYLGSSIVVEADVEGMGMVLATTAAWTNRGPSSPGPLQPGQKITLSWSAIATTLLEG